MDSRAASRFPSPGEGLVDALGIESAEAEAVIGFLRGRWRAPGRQHDQAYYHVTRHFKMNHSSHSFREN